jgi:hypothetical protein
VLWFVGYFAQTYHNLTRKHFLGIYGLRVTVALKDDYFKQNLVKNASSRNSNIFFGQGTSSGVRPYRLSGVILQT